jgi:hypothetical protein
MLKVWLISWSTLILLKGHLMMLSAFCMAYISMNLLTVGCIGFLVRTVHAMVYNTMPLLGGTT